MLMLEIIIRDHMKKEEKATERNSQLQSACPYLLTTYISAKNFGIEKPVMCIMRWRATRIVMK